MRFCNPRLVAILLTFALSGAAHAEEFARLRAAVERHIDESAARMLRELKDFLSLPNVSGKDDMLANARWIERYVGARGFEARTVSAGRAPYVLAERRASPTAPTILVYAHFDGQPVNANNWKTPPFEPTLKAGEEVLDWDEALAGKPSPEWRLYARSAGDDKAPVIALMHAVDALEKAGLPLAVNVKLILDGEEEAGSPTLARILEEHSEWLTSDLMLFCDGPMHQSRRRQLVFGVRGSVTVHLTAYGPNRPLHSGHYGNWAPHPTDELIRLLASLKDETGAILVPGYLDDVRPVTSAERAAISAMPEIGAELRDELALGRVEGGGARIEELVMRPAIIVKGFHGGGVGGDSRNIILPTSTASLNLRLVPDQTPASVRAALEGHFAQQGFHLVGEDPSDEIRRRYPKVLKVEWGGGYPAFRTPIDGPEARELTRIVAGFDGRSPLLTPTMGGSLPIYLFEEAMGIPIIILPIANHDNNQHGRDENLRLANLFDAIGVYAAVLSRYGR